MLSFLKDPQSQLLGNRLRKDLISELYSAGQNARDLCFSESNDALADSEFLRDYISSIKREDFPIIGCIRSFGGRRFQYLMGRLLTSFSKVRNEFRDHWYNVSIDVLKQAFPNAREEDLDAYPRSSEECRVGGNLDFCLLRYFTARYFDIRNRYQDLIEITNSKVSVCVLDELSLMVSVLIDTALKEIKWFTVFYMNYMLGTLTDVPERPGNFDISMQPLVCKGFHKFLLKNRRTPCLINTVFQGFKRCLPPISPIQVFNTLSGHHKDLTTHYQMEPELDLLAKNRVRSKIRELINLMDCGTGTLKNLGSVSTNSSDKTSRRCGGMLYQTVQLLERKGYLDPVNRFFSSRIELEEFWSKGRLRFRLETNIGPDDQDIFDAWRTYYLSEGQFTDPEATVKSVLEPNKSRTMTAGSPVTGAFLKPLQQQMLNMLSTLPHDPFKLVRDSDAVVESVEELRILSSGEYWNSGDYSSATDKMNSEFGSIVLEELLDYLEPYLGFQTSQAKKSMFNVTIHTNDKSIPVESVLTDSLEGKSLGNEWSVSYKQTNGQLMGSILSFPILCLVNFIAYWTALETFHGRTMEYEKIFDLNPVLVNGDDILFKGSLDFIQHWKQVVRQFGFFPSMGKNFVSREFFTINSKLFRDRGEDLELIPFINFGLLTGRKKGAATDIDCSVVRDPEDVERLGSLADIWNDIAVGAPRHVYRIKCWSKFVTYYSRLVSPKVKFREAAIADMVRYQACFREELPEGYWEKPPAFTRVEGSSELSLWLRNGKGTKVPVLFQRRGVRSIKVVRDCMNFLVNEGAYPVCRREKICDQKNKFWSVPSVAQTRVNNCSSLFDIIVPRGESLEDLLERDDHLEEFCERVLSRGRD